MNFFDDNDNSTVITENTVIEESTANEQSKGTTENEFFKEFDSVIESYEPESEPEGNESFFEVPTEKKDLAKIKSMNDWAAEFVVKGFDSLAAFLLSGYSRTGDVDRYKASGDEIEDITSIVKEMMPTTGVPLKPWMLLSVTLVRVYGVKFSDAAKDRKIKELEDENRRMKEENELRKKERDKEIEDLRYEAEKAKLYKEFAKTDNQTDKETEKPE